MSDQKYYQVDAGNYTALDAETIEATTENKEVVEVIELENDELWEFGALSMCSVSD